MLFVRQYFDLLLTVCMTIFAGWILHRWTYYRSFEYMEILFLAILTVLVFTFAIIYWVALPDTISELLKK